MCDEVWLVEEVCCTRNDVCTDVTSGQTETLCNTHTHTYKGQVLYAC